MRSPALSSEDLIHRSIPLKNSGNSIELFQIPSQLTRGCELTIIKTLNNINKPRAEECNLIPRVRCPQNKRPASNDGIMNTEKLCTIWKYLNIPMDIGTVLLPEREKPPTNGNAANKASNERAVKLTKTRSVNANNLPKPPKWFQIAFIKSPYSAIIR
jgi:hypothetical protein